MEDFRNDFVQFFSGATFWVTMAVLTAYGVGYAKFLQKVAAGDKQNERGEGQLARLANAIFWQRLRRFDFFCSVVHCSLFCIYCTSFRACDFALRRTQIVAVVSTDRALELR
jgi:hypothetical protein